VTIPCLYRDNSSLVVDGRDRYLPFMNGRGHERLGTNGQKCIRKFHVMVTVNGKVHKTVSYGVQKGSFHLLILQEVTN